MPVNRWLQSEGAGIVLSSDVHIRSDTVPWRERAEQGLDSLRLSAAIDGILDCFGRTFGEGLKRQEDERKAAEKDRRTGG